MSFDYENSRIDPPKPKWEEKPPLSVEEEISLYRSQIPQVRAALLPGLSRQAQTLLGKDGIYADSASVFGPNSRRMQTREHRTRAGHLITSRVGDPHCWMEQFMPPVKHILVALRGNSQDDSSWRQQCDAKEANIQKYGDPFPPTQAEFDAAFQKTRSG